MPDDSPALALSYPGVRRMQPGVARRIVLAGVRSLFAMNLIGRRRQSEMLLEHALCRLLVPRRMALPGKTIEELFPGAADARVELQRLPEGSWSTPLHDVVSLLKVVRLRQPRRVLELGSFRGYTALYLARCLPEGGRVVAVDIDPGHGSAYRGTADEARIERRVGAITPQLFAADGDGSYDFIFVDADHRYAGVRNDTEVALKLVRKDGLIAWHDYCNYGYFNGICKVPEYLTELAQQRALFGLTGTNLAFYSPVWDRSPPVG